MRIEVLGTGGAKFLENGVSQGAGKIDQEKHHSFGLTCRECGLEFLSSRENYCFDCEKKRNK